MPTLEAGERRPFDAARRGARDRLQQQRVRALPGRHRHAGCFGLADVGVLVCLLARRQRRQDERGAEAAGERGERPRTPGRAAGGRGPGGAQRLGPASGVASLGLAEAPVDGRELRLGLGVGHGCVHEGVVDLVLVVASKPLAVSISHGALAGR